MYNTIKRITPGLFKMIIEEKTKIGVCVFLMTDCTVCFILDIVLNI